MTAENVCHAWTALEHRPSARTERTVLDRRALSHGSLRKSGSGHQDADCDDIGRRYNRKAAVANAPGRPAGRASAGLPALPTRLGSCLQAVVRLRRAPQGCRLGLKAGALVGWEAMWLLAPSRTR